MRCAAALASLALAAACAAPRPAALPKPRLGAAPKPLSPAESAFQLAIDLYEGHGVDQDYERAFKTFLQAAGDGVVDSHLGYMYESGQGVGQDEAEAARWYRKAADRGDAEAQRRLASLYRDGRGLARDPVEAYAWFARAAAAGDAQAAAERDQVGAGLTAEQRAEGERRAR